MSDLYGEALAPGTIAGDHVIRGFIAQGGSGTVYLAEHRLLARRAALKVLHGYLAAVPEMVERFVREARAVNRIGHPNIVDIYELGVLPDGRPYFVMELLEGEDLDALLRRHGRFTADEAIALLEPVVSALAAAHAAGIVHRDLKPSNIAVAERDGRRVVKLLDFGIAKLLAPEPGSPQLTSVGRRLGTPQAMAPEQIRGGAIDARTDVYALGVLAFQLLTGQPPFRAADALELERLHLDAPAPAPSGLAPVAAAVDAVILRSLEKAAERRQPGVETFLAELRQAARREPAPAAGAQRSPAVGLLFEARLEEVGEDALDDAFLDDLAALLEEVEARLGAAGMATPIVTGSSVLGVRILPADAEAARAARAEALALAQALLAAAAARAPSLGVAVSLHVDSVLARGDVLSGPLLRLGAWAAPPPAVGLHATPAVKD